MNDTDEPVSYAQREVSLLAMAGFVWRHKRRIGLCVVVCALGAAALAFVMHNKYRAEVVFSPLSSSGGFSGGGMGGSLGGLAALAGISLGGGAKTSEESLAYLRSRQFTREFIERHGVMQVLFARQWDTHSGHWRGDPPTAGDTVDLFDKKIRQITEDHRTGLVTLAVIWREPVVAAAWANAMIAEADAALRQRAIAEHQRSLDYLKEEARSASLSEMQAAVDKTMENELKDAMLARTRDAYAFKVIDPAVVHDPKDFDSPNRPLIIAVGGGFGLLVGVIWAAVRQRRLRLRLR